MLGRNRIFLAAEIGDIDANHLALAEILRGLADYPGIVELPRIHR
jgi:hypothetical protein